MSADKSINHKITRIIHAAGLTDTPYSAYFSFFISFMFKIFKCSHVMFSECFLFFVFQFCTFSSSRHSSPIAAATGAFLSSFMPYELHGLLVCTEWSAFSWCGWPGQLFPSLSCCCCLRETTSLGVCRQFHQLPSPGTERFCRGWSGRVYSHTAKPKQSTSSGRP